MYALCTKIDGVILYLRRFSTTKYNSSSLETPMFVYEFAPPGDDTLQATREDWAYFLKDGSAFEEITKFMTMYDFTNFRLAFAKLEKEVVTTYKTSICNGFVLNAVDNPQGYTTYNASINWDSFC